MIRYRASWIVAGLIWAAAVTAVVMASKHQSDVVFEKAKSAGTQAAKTAAKAEVKAQVRERVRSEVAQQVGEALYPNLYPTSTMPPEEQPVDIPTTTEPGVFSVAPTTSTTEPPPPDTTTTLPEVPTTVTLPPDPLVP